MSELSSNSKKLLLLFFNLISVHFICNMFRNERRSYIQRKVNKLAQTNQSYHDRNESEQNKTITLDPKQNSKVSTLKLLRIASSLQMSMHNLSIFNQGASGIAFILSNCFLPSFRADFKMSFKKYTGELHELESFPLTTLP